MYIYEYAQTQTEQEATRRGGSFYFLLINLYEAAAKKIRVGRAEATDDVAQIRGETEALIIMSHRSGGPRLRSIEQVRIGRPRVLIFFWVFLKNERGQWQK